MFYLLLGLLGVVVFVRRWFTKEDSSEPIHLPGSLPLVGHALHAIGDSEHMFHILTKYSAIVETLDGVVKSNLGPIQGYGVTDPDDSLTILNECLQKLYIYDYMKPMLHNGLLTADVPTWKKNRKLLSPAFGHQVLGGFIEVFNERSENLVNLFAKEVEKPFDHEHLLQLHSLENICATSLGIAPDEYKTVKINYLTSIDEALYIFNTRIKSIWLHCDFLYNFSSLKRREYEVVKRIEMFIDSIIQKKRNEMKNQNHSNYETGKFKPFIELLLNVAEEDPSFTDKQILGETSNAIFGGYDTLAAAFTFALTLLGSHHKIQDKAYQEIIEVLKNKTYVSKDDLTKLVYIEAIVCEVLRLYPSAPGIARYLTKDVKLKNCTLKAGRACLISLYGCLRHPMWGQDRHDFRPDRWLDKATLPHAKYFTAFSMGRRSCIGKTYAMTLMKITLAHVIRSYIITSDVNQMVVKMDITIKPARGHYITLKHRP